MKPFGTGLVVGKFCPLHLGHERVIHRAIELCERVIVLSYTRPELPGCEPEKRERWLAARFPQIDRWVITEKRLLHEFRPLQGGPLPLPENTDSDLVHRRFVGRFCLDVLQRTVDAVFTSEDYGDGFAAELTRFFAERMTGGGPVVHHRVDVQRNAVPISGTQLRQDPHAGKAFLSPVVYASFVERVAILGAESSGKSTLAAALAEAFNTVCVPEFGRELWVEKSGQLSFPDLLTIAETQCAREDALAEKADRFLFCDTTPLTTLFYSQHLFSQVDPRLVTLAQRPYHRTFFCLTDFPFVQDGTREGASLQPKQNQWYQRELAARGINAHVASGSLSTRIRQFKQTCQYQLG